MGQLEEYTIYIATNFILIEFMEYVQSLGLSTYVTDEKCKCSCSITVEKDDICWTYFW